MSFASANFDAICPNIMSKICIPERKVKNVGLDVKIQYLQFRKEEGEGGETNGILFMSR